MATGPAAIIVKHFENVTDPRVNRGDNYPLMEMMFMALTAAICGANGWADVERFAQSKLQWFRQFIRLKRGVPSHDTFGRVFARLDTAEFLTAMHAWVDTFAGSLRGRGVAIDGKTLRGSFDKATGQSALHTITAFAWDTRTVLRQMSVDAKSNEIPAVPVLLRMMELSGAIVTLDAMHCQRKTAKAIVDSDATYLLTVKANQPTLYSHMIGLFDSYREADFRVKGLRKHVTVERSHGREERREYYVIPVPKKDKVFACWPDVKSIGMVFRDRKEGEKEHCEITFYITNHAAKVRALSEYLRSHWSIENSQHWVLDVTFAEDASRIRKDGAPEIAGAFRRMALNILQQDTSIKENVRGKRLRAGWDARVLDAIYAGFSAI